MPRSRTTVLSIGAGIGILLLVIGVSFAVAYAVTWLIIQIWPVYQPSFWYLFFLVWIVFSVIGGSRSR